MEHPGVLLAPANCCFFLIHSGSKGPCYCRNGRLGVWERHLAQPTWELGGLLQPITTKSLTRKLQCHNRQRIGGVATKHTSNSSGGGDDTTLRHLRFKWVGTCRALVTPDSMWSVLRLRMSLKWCDNRRPLLTAFRSDSTTEMSGICRIFLRNILRPRHTNAHL